MRDIIGKLLESAEPSIRLKTLRDLLDADPSGADIVALQQEVRTSPRVQALLSERDVDGRIPHNPYKKWNGAHWVLATLADIGYPPGDTSLIPLRDQVYDFWLSPQHTREYICTWRTSRSKSPGVPIIEGRTRRCASQEGNALHSTVKLGLADARAEDLARNLMRWQWTDGGWNCDRRPKAVNSSFWESLVPLRALALYARESSDEAAKAAAARAADVFLKRRLFKRQADGTVMKEEFTRLHYPWYWRYDILFALKVMAEAGFIRDERCRDALDLLESKHMADGGFPAEEKYYQLANPGNPRYSVVDWGGASKKRSNEWVTVEALCVLKAAGRWSGDA